MPPLRAVPCAVSVEGKRRRMPKNAEMKVFTAPIYA
jgi:hypothetical protein